MNFLVVLSAWALLQWRGPVSALHRDHWLHFWYLRAAAALAALPMPVRLLLVVALPALLVHFIAWVLAPLLGGLLLFLFALAVLSYSLGRRDYRSTVEAYLQRWERGDIEAAYEAAVALDIVPLERAVTGPPELHRLVRERLLYSGYERWFGVVFWFALLGPGAALAYRSVQILRRDGHATQEERGWLDAFLRWIDWVPVRLVGLAFAITGSFAGCFRRWCESWGAEQPASELLVAYELEALEGSAVQDREGRELTSDRTQPFIARAASELREITALLGRSAIAWLVALALLQLF